MKPAKDKTIIGHSSKLTSVQKNIYSNPTPTLRKYVDKNPCFIST
jgi:hypothetical protein